MNIRLRLFLSHICIILLILVGIYFFLNFSLTELLSHNIDVQLRNQAQLVRDFLVYTLPNTTNYTYQKIDQFIDELEEGYSGTNQLGSRITFIDLQGKVWGDSRRDGKNLQMLDNHSRRPEIVEAMINGFGSSERFSDTLKEEVRYYAVLVKRDGKPIGICRVAMEVKSIKKTLFKVKKDLFLAGLVGLSVAIVLATISAQTIISPLQKIRETADEIASGNIESRVEIPPGRELADFARYFNQMVDQVQEQLQKSHRERNRLETILSSMNEGVLMVNDQYEITYTNLASKRLLNLSDQSIGQSLIEANRNPKLYDLFQLAQVHNKQAIAELTLDPMEARETQVTIVPLVASNEYLILFFDVSQLRQLERMRSDFMVNVSHELRTPLTTIEGYAEILLDSGLESQKGNQFIAKIIEQSGQMALLISDLLRLARLESGAIPLDRVSCTFGEFYQPLIDVFAPIIEDEELELKWLISETLPSVFVDPKLIRQVFVNLVDNAIKHSEKGDEIHIRAKIDGNMLQCMINDHGIGIPKAAIPRIFERFYRVDKARTRSISGTGLGLSICKHICLQHGGAIWVESEVGQGSSFFFTLPIYRPEIHQSSEQTEDTGKLI